MPNLGISPVRVDKSGAAANQQVTDYAGPTGYARGPGRRSAGRRSPKPEVTKPMAQPTATSRPVSMPTPYRQQPGPGTLYNSRGTSYNTQDRLLNAPQFYHNPYNGRMEQRFVGRDNYQNIYAPRASSAWNRNFLSSVSRFGLRGGLR